MAFLQIFSIFGNSIVNTEGEEWRHHRRIVGPVFNEGMNAAVWQTTSDVMLELFSKWEAGVSPTSIPVQSFLEIAMEMTLLVLCRAGNLFYLIGGPVNEPFTPGFGQFVSWNSHDQIPAGHSRVSPPVSGRALIS